VVEAGQHARHELRDRHARPLRGKLAHRECRGARHARHGLGASAARLKRLQRVESVEGVDEPPERLGGGGGHELGELRLAHGTWRAPDSACLEA